MYFIILLLFSFSQIQADTLLLKNGRQLEGTYVGGTRLRVRFEVQNKIQHIPTANIVSLTFAHPKTTPTPNQPDRPSAARPNAPHPPQNNLRQTGAPKETLSAKTVLTVRLTTPISTATQKRGDRFSVVLTEKIGKNKHALLAQDTKLYGRITTAKPITSGTAQLGLELTSVTRDNHLYSLTTNRITLSCDGDMLTLTSGENVFDAHTEIGDFITESGNIQLPAHLTLRFVLTAPLHIRPPTRP